MMSQKKNEMQKNIFYVIYVLCVRIVPCKKPGVPFISNAYLKLVCMYA